MLVSPTAPTTAFPLGEKVDDPLAMYLNDLATIPANLAGVPGISVPSGLADEDGLPAGVQILAPALPDDRRLPRRRRPRGAAARAVGRAAARPGPEPGRSGAHDRRRRTRSSRTTTCSRATTRSSASRSTSSSTPRPRCSAAARPSSAPSPTPRPARPAWACRARCRWSTRKAVESAIRIGLALNCEIAEWCRFARKNYFYPDMPKNFQTSPVRRADRVRRATWTSRWTARRYRVEIERAHMEEDTGKSLHVGGAPAGSTAPTTPWSTTTAPASR